MAFIIGFVIEKIITNMIYIRKLSFFSFYSECYRLIYRFLYYKIAVLLYMWTKKPSERNGQHFSSGYDGKKTICINIITICRRCKKFDLGLKVKEPITKQ